MFVKSSWHKEEVCEIFVDKSKEATKKTWKMKFSFSKLLRNLTIIYNKCNENVGNSILPTRILADVFLLLNKISKNLAENYKVIALLVLMSYIDFKK